MKGKWHTPTQKLLKGPISGYVQEVEWNIHVQSCAWLSVMYTYGSLTPVINSERNHPFSGWDGWYMDVIILLLSVPITSWRDLEHES